MGTESNEVQLARMDERLTVMMQELLSAKDSRKDADAKMEAMGRSLVSIDNRVQSVEQSFAKASPTIDEFITIKHKVVGAGIVGKWVWAAGAFLIGMIYASREQIIAWIRG